MGALPNNSTRKEDEVHLLDYLIVVAKYSRMIIFLSGAVMVLTYLYLFLKPNQYQATARLLTPRQNMNISSRMVQNLGVSSVLEIPGGGGLGSAFGSMMGLRTPGDLYVGMMEGATVQSQIVERFNLQEHYQEKLLEDARKKLSTKAKISVGKDALINIIVTDKDPKMAAKIANAFGEELDKLLQRVVSQDAQNNLVFLEKERAQANLNLIKAEEALRAFSEHANVLQIDTQTKGMIEYIARLRAEIDAKEVQIKVLRQQATSSNYDVIRLETEIKGLKEKQREAETRTDDKECIGDVCLPTGKVPTVGLDYLRLVREAKFQELLCQQYYKLEELARLDKVRNVPSVQMLDRASVPQKRSNKRLFPAMLAGGLTFFIMVFVAFIREFWQYSKEREGHSERIAMLSNYLEPWLRLRNLFLSRLKRLTAKR